MPLTTSYHFLMWFQRRKITPTMATTAIVVAFAFNRTSLVHIIPLCGGAHSHPPD